MGHVKIGETGGISVIDFGGFLDGSQKQAVADEMLASLKHAGFICLINHGLPKAKIDSMFEWVRVLAVCGCDLRDSHSRVPMVQSRRFFSLPIETKMLAPHPPSGTHHRGQFNVIPE